MEDAPQNRSRHTAVLIGLLLILAIIVWYGGNFVYTHWIHTATQGNDKATSNDVDLTDLRFMTAKEVLSRLDRKENILFLDIRPKESFDFKHAVDAVSIPVVLLNSFSSNPGQLIIVISGPDIPNVTLKGVHDLFMNRKFTFAFLQNGLPGWEAAGGLTVSSGDPSSIIDYSKVIFVNPEQVPPLREKLVDPLFIDVRDNAAFTTSHIPDAINIPLSELEKRRSEIPRSRSILIYGNNDYESYQGGVRLFDFGYFGARVIRGGFLAWQEKKLPIVSNALNTKP